MTTKRLETKETKSSIPISQLRIPTRLKERTQTRYPDNNFTQIVIAALTDYLEAK